METDRQGVQITIFTILAVLSQPKVWGYVSLSPLIGSYVRLRSCAKVDQDKPPRFVNKLFSGLMSLWRMGRSIPSSEFW